MGVRGGFIDMKLFHDGPAEFVFRDHAPHSMNNDLGGIQLHLLFKRPLFFAARVGGVAEIFFQLRLFASELHHVRIDYDDVVAVVLVGRIGDLVFPD
jgi:hypothetical protein